MHHSTMATPAHSGLGIASFIISLAAGFTLLVLFGVAGVLESQHGGLDEESAAAIVLGLVMVIAVLAQLLALGLGIAGMVQTERNKLFGVLGTVFSTTGLLGCLLLLLFGALIEV